MTDDTGTHILQCPECKARSGSIWAISPKGWDDGALYWRCLACGYAWHRFMIGSPEWELAEDAMREVRSHG